jgi:aldose 1-epimerase
MISGAPESWYIKPMAAPIAPSGEQIEISLEDQQAVVTEVGAGLRTYSAGGREVLVGYPPDQLAPSGRGQLLVPWPNRIRDGVYELDGRRHQLPLNELERGNAIHGLVRWSSWAVVERAAGRVVLAHVLRPQPGYPFSLALNVEYSLLPDGLAVRTQATNVGAETAPYGAGAHPYLSVDTETVDETVLRVPARAVLEADERSIPVGSRSVEGTALDFRKPRPIGSAQLDHCFTDLDRGEDGLARVEAGATTLWSDESYPYLMIFTGDGLPDGARRSLAVEPMTCAPNAFASGDGVVLLEPGESHAAAWGISPRSVG